MKQRTNQTTLNRRNCDTTLDTKRHSNNTETQNKTVTQNWTQNKRGTQYCTKRTKEHRTIKTIKPLNTRISHTRLDTRNNQTKLNQSHNTGLRANLTTLNISNQSYNTGHKRTKSNNTDYKNNKQHWLRELVTQMNPKNQSNNTEHKEPVKQHWTRGTSHTTMDTKNQTTLNSQGTSQTAIDTKNQSNNSDHKITNSTEKQVTQHWTQRTNQTTLTPRTSSITANTRKQ